jgi:hypothetical protein
MNVHIQPQFTEVARPLPFEYVALVLQSGRCACRSCDVSSAPRARMSILSQLKMFDLLADPT